MIDSVEYYLKSLKCLAPYMILIIGTTFAAAIVLILLTKNAWFDKKRFSVIGLFYSLDLRSILSLAAAWMVFVLSVAYALNQRETVVQEYIFFLIPGLVFLFSARPFSGILGRFLWLTLLYAGVYATDLVNGYIDATYATTVLTAVDVIVTVLVILFSVYIFIMELESISQHRKTLLFGEPI